MPDTNEENKQENQLKIDYSDPVVGGKGIEQFASDQITQPALPSGTQTPFLPIEEQDEELLKGGTGTTEIETPKAQVAQSTVAQADAEAPGVTDLEAPTYDATLGEAAQGEVDTNSLVRTQLANLMKDVEEGTPAWASGAIRLANNEMIKRGFGASTAAGAAISQAVMEAAMPIAKLDAATFGQMNLENLRNRQSEMLTNVAAENAAKQFNAKSVQETDQFMASFRDRIIRFNVEQKNGMEKFNTEQENSVNQFYDKMLNDMDKFLANNKMTIQKSNAEWRRTANLANTAAANAAMQQDVQNRFNISQQALADMWQRARDVFHWANQSSENSKERAAKITYYALERSDFMADRSHDEKNKLWGLVGETIADVIKNW